MNDWIRSLKKSIEQIRNNNRTNNSAAGANSQAVSATTAIGPAFAGGEVPGSNPSSPRQQKSPLSFKDKQLAKKRDGGKADEDDGAPAQGGRKKKEGEANKENVGEHRFTDTSLRRRRANPSSQSMDEGSLGPENQKQKNKKALESDQSLESGSSAHNSLGRKQKNKSTGFAKFRGGIDTDGLTFGSLGRQSAANKNSGKGSGGDSGDSGSSGMERRKRKADEDMETDLPSTANTGPQLESVTKHRVKGPSGRRMPQSRRNLMMKHRASSLSALAHNSEQNNQDNPANSFVPWLNRSLDLLGEEDQNDLVPQSRNSQPGLGYLYSDGEDLDDPEEQLYEYNISYHDERNHTFEENNTGLFVQDVQGFMQRVPPPLPPRMESRMEYTAQGLNQQNQLQVQTTHQYQMQQQQQQQLQQQLTQLQFHQASLHQQQNQMCSPFGTNKSDILTDRDMKIQNRKSQPMDEMNELLMTRSMNNELFIASYSDETSCDASNPQLNPTNQRQMVNGNQKQNRQKPNGRANGQKNRKLMSQPDLNRFTVAVRNLQKHVVELDQAVNGITKEVEDSKVDLGSIKSSMTSIKKDKDRLNDAVSIVTQEVTKMKDQVTTSMKEADKLQKTATAALVVAEKAKVDQTNLKKEYELMLKDLKTTIQDIKVNSLRRNMSVTPSPNIPKRGTGGRSEKGDESDADEEFMTDDDEADQGRDKNVQAKSKQPSSKTSTPRGSSSKLNDGKVEGKSGVYQTFFSRPSSIISGLTSIGRSSASLDGQEKGKKSKKNKTSKITTKNLGQLSDDFPMMDETIGSPSSTSPISHNSEAGTGALKENNNFEQGKSTSSPNVASRPRDLNLKPHKFELSTNKCNSEASSPDSPTRSSSPFDLPKLHVNGRATSPTGFALLRPGSTPGPMIRQGSMSTVPEDRAVDVRNLENRPSDPPPPPPKNRVFAISRHDSTPNIATQSTTTPMGLQRQHSLDVVLEESKAVSRHGSLLSMPDDRLLVDKTLTMSPTPSMMSIPGSSSWSITSLNKPEIGLGRQFSPKPRAKNSLEMVAGGVLSGSSLSTRTICPLDDKDKEGPFATSSLKRRKKVKKDPVDA